MALPLARPTADQVQQMRNLKAEGLSKAEIGRKLGFGKDTIRRYLDENRKVVDAKEVVAAPEREYTESGDSAKLVMRTSKPIKTLAELEESCGVNLEVWRVDRWGARQWTTTVKNSAGKPEVVQNFSVWCDFKRTMSKSLQDATTAIFDRMAKHSPKYIGLPKFKNKSSEEFLAVLSLADHHFGKRCWDQEVGGGGNYDLRIAEVIFKNAVEDLLEESKSRPISRWMMGLGNDLLHTDSSKNTTTAGTPQDVDGRYAKMIETAELSVIWAIEKMIEIAPVDILHVPGNHDQESSYHLARTVWAWFRKCDRVTVDTSPNPRKYYFWNKTLIGMTHGCDEKVASLPSIMATERPKEWAASDCREWLLGHMHRHRKWMTQGADTFEGTTVRVMRSLTKSDRWHHQKGFIGTEKSRGAEILFYGAERGYCGHAIVGPRES